MGEPAPERREDSYLRENELEAELFESVYKAFQRDKNA